MIDALEPLIMPRPHQKEWWEGNPYDIPLLGENDDNPSVFILRDLLSKEQCQTMIDAFERNYEERAEHTGISFWDGRYIQFHDIMDKEIDAARIMQQLRLIASMYITNEFMVEAPIYPDTAQIVRWKPGMSMHPHADNLKPDGSPNISPHRDFTAIAYLNDDYEGGHTYFPGLDIRVAPKAGTVVMFGAGYDYVHGVTEVTKGTRYMYSGWFTYDKSWLDVAAAKVI